MSYAAEIITKLNYADDSVILTHPSTQAEYLLHGPETSSKVDWSIRELNKTESKC